MIIENKRTILALRGNRSLSAMQCSDYVPKVPQIHSKVHEVMPARFAPHRIKVPKYG
jgi:hypothetical protein